MVIISNSQRDQILRFLDRLRKEVDGTDVRSCETRRLARNLSVLLKKKPTVDRKLIRK